MTERLTALRGISLRYKILIPVIALSLVTWILAAGVLGRSSAASVRTHAQSQSREVAESAARQLELRAEQAGSEVLTRAAEAQLIVGDKRLDSTLRKVGPNVLAAFLPSSGIAGVSHKDLIKVVVDGKSKPILDLRRNLLEPRALDDADLIAAARTRHAASQIVKVVGEQNAYVVGAAAVRLHGSELVTFLVGDAIDESILTTNALPKGFGLFVVDDGGVITSGGNPSSLAGWDTALKDTTEGDVTVDGTDYLLTSIPVRNAGDSGIRMVAAIPTKPILAAADEGRNLAWIVLGIGGLVMVVMGFWTTILLTRPLLSLTVAARRLTAGDLTARSDLQTNDEIGRLGVAFDTMGAQLQERDRHLREVLEKLTELSQTDPLTGLYNHRALHQELEREVSRACRQGLTLTVAVIDIDDFKMINDTYGHPTGDQVIRQVSDVLRSHCRSEDTLGRHGGDEFMLLLPGTSSDDAVRVIEKLRAAMRGSPLLTDDGLRIPIRLSVGTASYPEDGATLNELVAQSDAHLYESKRRGGDAITRRVEASPLEELASGGFGMLDSLVTAVDNKDRYTRRHSEEVTRYAVLIADRMGLSDESQRVLRAAGLLHDVGKIGVPDALLRKPAHLTESEREIVRHHATLGALMIQGLPDESEIRRAVATHHERWDGRGYPAGLSGETIPILGRILAVADVFSAMTSDRPYRKALDEDEALTEIERSAGTQLDPGVVQAFLLAFRETGILRSAI
jgi:diguanylate cyclase (GGDEF)-like protein/putative nucleotidyltransferase with HDIG domain